MKARDLFRTLAPLGKTQQSWLFAHLVKKDYGDVYLENPPLEDELLQKAREILKRVEAGEPLAYLLSESYFYGRRFKVTPDVLIPRPETEGLVELALDLPWESALDLCTGSGVIAISLDLETGKKRRVEALDLSEKALNIAKDNAKTLSSTVHFFSSDLFTEVEKKYDLLISNPPYVESEELRRLPVGTCEPHLALDGGEDGLDLIRTIFRDAPHFLNEDGYLLLEIGENQAQEVIKMSKAYFYGIIKSDLANKVRYFVGKKRKSC